MTDIKLNFSKNLQNFRKVWGMSQDRLAKHLNVKRSAVGAYEEGRALPRFDQMLRISNKLGFDIETLLTKDVYKEGGGA
ncbi:helix-turn-helix domain-containing protein [Pedobacter sp. BS3]|uniref:helix-turn-helix domain-containing protein n=1 Tax=Pedobacter sp. BS3 TaxID=2567937 RepID=UPI00165A0A34|nr:helix-turn-helix transcriptional regulator [Pedobacter sp. BS3]